MGPNTEDPESKTRDFGLRVLEARCKEPLENLEERSAWTEHEVVILDCVSLKPRGPKFKMNLLSDDLVRSFRRRMRIDDFLEVLCYGSVGILSLGMGGGEVGGGGSHFRRGRGSGRGGGGAHQGLLRGAEADGGEEWQVLLHPYQRLH
ncbi:hypothetical protein AMTR_s00154p00066430 [Amborella trichopoda]|uniref:Uncharacterized protein n=1 Tax=Amborella trichopoda TaxID=13333 RepID=W1PKA7_AMBTC|nr:hypothetical protein AMTR_s00154p00066430 [Amborella trichopoda]